MVGNKALLRVKVLQEMEHKGLDGGKVVPESQHQVRILVYKGKKETLMLEKGGEILISSEDLSVQHKKETLISEG